MNAKLFAAAPALLALGFALPTSRIATSSELASPAAVETYAIDPGHSGALFRVKHLGVSYFHGRFNQVEGSYKMDPADLTSGSIEVTIQTSSIDTNSEQRDGHLKSADFFDVEQFPTITFRSKAVAKGSRKDHYTVKGDLELHGVTKSVEAELEYVGSGGDPWGGHRSGFEASFTLKRSDFGMSYYLDNGALGDEIDVTVFIEGTRQSEG